MKYKKLLIEENEFDLLKRIISLAQHDKSDSYRLAISALKEEMTQAEIVKNKELPVDVIRFNSIVHIETPFLTKKYQIVTPDKSSIAHDKISILAPMGLALFGYAIGDELTWDFPTGKGTIKIIDVTHENTLYNGKHSKIT